MQLRWYQADAHTALWNSLCKESGNPLVVMPTGTGKALTLAAFVKGILSTYPTLRILILSHVAKILEQDAATLRAIWPEAPIGIYSAGIGAKVIAPITIAGVASIHKKLDELGKIDLIFIDEAHLVGDEEGSMYLKIVENLQEKNSHLRVIGLTATPWRLKMGHLTNGPIFSSVCYDMNTPAMFQRLISEGFMAPLVPKRGGVHFDLSEVRMVGGDFEQGKAQEVMGAYSLNEKVVAQIISEGQDRHHWMIFSTGVEHTNSLVRMFQNSGIPTAGIHSKMKSKEIEQNIYDFKRGNYRALVNQNMLTTGFDFPELDLIAVLRPTKSVSLWVQILGRGTRPAEGKENCLILDYCENTKRLGPIDDPEIPGGKLAGGGGEAPMRTCPVCSTYCHASARVCPQCGEEFPRESFIETIASILPLLKGKEELPVIEDLPITHVSYAKHSKVGSPDSVVASYVCGLKAYREWVCFEHVGFARRKALQWWLERGGEGKAPDTTAEALTRIKEVKTPSKLRIHINKKYPEILGAIYE